MDEPVKVTKKAFDCWLRVSGDLYTLMSGGLGERIAAIAAICKKMVPIDAVRIHWLTENGLLHVGEEGVHGSGACPREGQTTTVTSADQKLAARVVATGRPLYVAGAARGSSGGPCCSDDRRPLSRARYLLPLGPEGKMVCLLIAETADSGGIPTEIRHLLDLLAPYFTMAIDDARRPGDGPWPHARAEVQRPPATDATARIAHDIKNAMTSVSTFMQLLAAKWDNPHFRSSFYPVARDEAMRVNGLVHALLDRGKQGFLKRVAVDLRTVLEHILALKAPLADQRRLRMRIHDHLSLATIRIDPEAIEETLVNLLSNAIEASPDGGRIDIGLKDDRLPSGQPAIRLEIQDSGPGVDNALRETIFAPYMSTKTGDLSSGGTGLGLTIARRHIEAHGGTITVMGSTNGGALFRVLLPLERRRG